MSAVEMTVVVLLCALLLGSITMALERASSIFEHGTAAGDVNARAARALFRVSQELIGARRSTLAPAPALPFGTDTLEFETAVDTAGSVITWGPRRQIALQLAAGELDNGVDDDGDGLIDERSIVRVDNPGLPGVRRTVLVNGVGELLEGEVLNAADDNGNGLIDEAGLCFSEEDGALVVRLTLERIGPERELLRRTQQVSVFLRNSEGP
jgi:hypothetical protein